MSAEADQQGGGQAVPEAGAQAPAKTSRRHEKRRARAGRRDRALGFRLFLVLLAFAVVAAGLSLRLSPMRLPVWAVAEVEDRLNGLVDEVFPRTALALGGMTLALDRNWSPVLVMDDLRVLQAGGQRLLFDLPEAEVVVDPASLITGEVKLQSLRLRGARVELRRDAEGRINLSFDQALALGNSDDEAALADASLAGFFGRLEAALDQPELAAFERLEVEGLTMRLFDQRLGRSFDLGDGRLVAENRADALLGELSFSLLGTDGPGAPRATLRATTRKGEDLARVAATIQDIPARDLAAQHPVLAWLGAIEAPISGELDLALERTGVSGLSGRLSLGEGALRPAPDATPIAFTKAALGLTYEPEAGRLRLSEVSVESRTLRAHGQGQVYLLAPEGTILRGTLGGTGVAAYLGQLRLDDLGIDPEGLFTEPVQFSQGALDLRLVPDPFTLEIGRLSLTEGARSLTLSGRAGIEKGGWTAALDVAMNEVTVARLMQLWPVNLVPKTREWAGKNLLTGNLTDVDAAFRIVPGEEPRIHLDYDFADAEVRYMATMPPITGGVGTSVIEGKVNTVRLTRGIVTPPQGGVLDLAGSALRVPDIYAKPATGIISLRARGPAEAMLSILDQKPFEYLTKAGRPVALGSGEATLAAEISLPLAKGVKPTDVAFTAEAVVHDFRSDVLVAGREIVLPEMRVNATPEGLVAGGPGTIDGLPFDAAYKLPFRPGEGPPRVEGRVTLSPQTVEVFDLGLPPGMVAGKGEGLVTIDLPKGAPGELTLTSDLSGLRLALPEVGWSKPAATPGQLALKARLSDPPAVPSLTISAAGLEAKGSLTFRDGGRLDRATFAHVTLGGWLDGAVEIEGSNPLGFAVTSGAIDFRAFPGPEARGSSGSGGTAGSPLRLRLDEFRVTDGIILRDFAGDFRLTDGPEGSFTARMGDRVALQGAVAPSPHGTAVRVISEQAGGAFREAGIFDSARGGRLDMTLTPRAESGTYDGRAVISDIRVQNDNVLAELLNAVSVIGLLEQLNGSGIVFAQAEADFLLAPPVVEITRSSAVGASMGVSMEGQYFAETGRLAMTGVISPVYLLNGIGAIFTRKGEGLFGFTYRLDGTSDDPDVSVNPLSILTPGMFRDLFRADPPAPEGDSAQEAPAP